MMQFQPLEQEGGAAQGPACHANIDQENPVQKESRKRSASALLFIVACAVSPCCAPLWVPLSLSLLGGAPLALWAVQNGGWLYGGLTLISVVLAVLGYVWWKKGSVKDKEAS